MNRDTEMPTRTALNLLVVGLLSWLLVACPATPVNHAPQANDQIITTNGGTPIDVTLDIADEDGDDLTCTITHDPRHGTLTGMPPDLTYTPDADFAGTDAFTYTASDGYLTSPEATVTIIVDDANEAPVVVPPNDQELIQNFVSPRSLHLTFGATDEDGDALTVSATSDNHDVVTDEGLHILCDAGQCELGFSCERSDAQTATITLEASDGTDTGTAKFQVRIGPRLVTNTGDDGPGSLRQVVDNAVQGDVITFDTQGTFATAQTIVLTTGQIRIETPMLIQGPGQDMLTISAGDASRVFRIGTDDVLRFYHQAVVRDITVTNGNGSPRELGEPSAYGGAIQVSDRAVLERVTIRNSSADEGGGVAIYVRFPLARDPLGTLATLRDCVVEDNAAHHGGGGIYVWLDGRTQASVRVEDCVVRRNEAAFNDPIFGAGIQGGRVEVVNTTIEENDGCGFSGGGEIRGSTIRGNEGCGVYGEGSMTNTVVEGNASLGPGGGLYVYGAYTVDASTIAGNTAGTGAGIYINSGSVTLTNGSIVRENTAELLGGGALVSGGTLRVEDATIRDNIADSGGGVYIGMGTVVLEPATSITTNTALTDGGGIYNRDGTLEGAVADGNVHDNDPNDIAP